MFRIALVLFSFIALSAPAHATKVGEAVPDLVATDIYGNEFNLSDHKDKIVVLEWTNHECPCIIKHYDSGNMQALQKKVTDQGALWVSIVSSAPGTIGQVTAERAQEIVREAGANETTRIMDPSGEIGMAFKATTTPHMFVIDKGGVLAYKGALDESESYDPATIATSYNYVDHAVQSLMNNEEVEIAFTKPFGCAIHYANDFPEWK